MPEYSADQFATVLLDAVKRTPRETVQVVREAAGNVKSGARRNVLQTAPVHNAGAHKYINFGDPAPGLIVESEIGYDKVRGGKLGNLLEFGGGGDHSPPHRDLSRALDVEEPRFESAIGDMGERLLDLMVTIVDAQPLVDAITAAINAQSLAVGDGEKPTVVAGRPYVVAWFDSGSVENRSLISRDGFSLVVSFQVYGLDPDSVRWAVRKLRTAVFGLHLTTVSGRTVQMPEHLVGPPMARDDDADPSLWWQYDEFRFRTSA